MLSGAAVQLWTRQSLQFFLSTEANQEIRIRYLKITSVSITERMILNPRLALRRISSLKNFVVLGFITKAWEEGVVLIAALINFSDHRVPTSAGKPSEV